jgi:hypothetical protein
VTILCQHYAEYNNPDLNLPLDTVMTLDFNDVWCWIQEREIEKKRERRRERRREKEIDRER